MVLLGYARVSTADQNPDHQTDALARAGIGAGDVYLDHASGAKASRPQLDALLRALRAGDTLVVTRLDRLGRSVLHLVQLGAHLRERGIGLRVLEQGIDTSTAEGRAMFGMFSVLAELQRELIAANTRDGLAAARARGRRGGRPARLSPRPGRARPRALRRRRAHRRRDRQPLRPRPHHRLRAPAHRSTDRRRTRPRHCPGGRRGRWFEVSLDFTPQPPTPAFTRTIRGATTAFALLLVAFWAWTGVGVLHSEPASPFFAPLACVGGVLIIGPAVWLWRWADQPRLTTAQQRAVTDALHGADRRAVSRALRRGDPPPVGLEAWALPYARVQRQRS